jgi:hypothetical protein
MNAVNYLQHHASDDTIDQSETARGSFGIAVLVSAIVFASLVMVLAIVVTAQTLQI